MWAGSVNENVVGPLISSLEQLQDSFGRANIGTGPAKDAFAARDFPA